MPEGKINTISPDNPGTDRSDDRLNRAPFADRIARILINSPADYGLVVGIHGEWGEGKTTVLNFIRGSLSLEESIIVRDFNPWRFSDEEEILRGFFKMLADAMGASLATSVERTKGKLNRIVSKFRWLTKLLKLIWKSAETADELLAKFCDYANKGDSVNIEELRSRIIRLLRNSSKRIVVLIDDIDRLDKDEIYTLFRVIKACADFPNVCYLLSFDDLMTARAIGRRYGSGDESSGRDFLEKIIQIPLKLPVAAKEDLRSLCLEFVDKALESSGINLTQNEIGEFVFGFDKNISVRLTTPRTAKRYGNGLMFSLPMLKNETNHVDLLLVEALRAFFPEVYSIVRDNHKYFSGAENDHRSSGDKQPEAIILLKPVIESMQSNHADAINNLLRKLFPRLASSFGHGRYGIDWLEQWSREKRICSPEYCLRYFSYSIPLNDIADAEIENLLEAAEGGNVPLVESCLKKYLTEKRAHRFIVKLRDKEKTLGNKAAKLLAIELAKMGYLLPNHPSLFNLNNPPSQAAILISNLLILIPSGPERISSAKDIMISAKPLWFGVECLRWLYVTDKPERYDSNTLTKNEVDEVRLVLVERIKNEAKNGNPLFNPEVFQESSQLFEWMRAEGKEPVQTHLDQVFKKDPKQVARFLQTQAPVAWSMGEAVPHVGDLDANHLKNIKLIIDLDLLAKWVRKTCPGNFDCQEYPRDDNMPVEQRLAEQFMYIYKHRKKNREPQDNKNQVIDKTEKDDT